MLQLMDCYAVQVDDKSWVGCIHKLRWLPRCRQCCRQRCCCHFTAAASAVTVAATAAAAPVSPLLLLLLHI